MGLHGNEKVFTLDINRDGLNAPWGFRLKGGRDVDGGTPLEIIKIGLGSATEGILKVGDRIHAINHRDASKLTHVEAQNIFKKAGTSVQLTVSRPTLPFYQAPVPEQQYPSPQASSPDMWDGGNHGQQHQQQPYQSPMAGRHGQDMHSQALGAGGAYNYRSMPQQPYRTTQLVFPGAKSVYYKDRELNGNPTSASLPLPIPYGRTECHNNGVSDHMSPHGLPEAVENQPFRTTPLILPSAKTSYGLNEKPYVSNIHDFNDKPFRNAVMRPPAPKTILEVKSSIRDKLATTSPPLFELNHDDGGFHYQNPHQPPQSKTIQIGGVKKQVTTNQFNSPLNLYSDESIADAVVMNKNAGLGAGPTHPGFVDERPHLPLPKDATFSRPHQSATFKLILESEMDKAKNQQGIHSKEFLESNHQQRPGSSLSNKSSPPDPVMLDKSISQSASFKRVMQAVLNEPEYSDPN